MADQFNILDRSTSVPLPRLKAAHWYWTPGASRGSAAIINERAYAAPVMLGAGSLDRIGIGVTVVGAAGSTIRLGLYADDGYGFPGALLLDAGTVAGDAVAEPTISINQAIGSGQVWVVAVAQGAAAGNPTVRTLSAANRILSGPSMSAFSTVENNGYLTAAGSVPGALPATFPTANTGSAGIQPVVAVRAA